MEERLKSLEIELSYLHKEILEMKELIKNLDVANYYYLTNCFYSKAYLDSLNDDYKKE